MRAVNPPPALKLRRIGNGPRRVICIHGRREPPSSPLLFGDMEKQVGLDFLIFEPWTWDGISFGFWMNSSGEMRSLLDTIGVHSLDIRLALSPPSGFKGTSRLQFPLLSTF